MLTVPPPALRDAKSFLTLMSGKAVSFDAQLNGHIVHSGYVYHAITKSPLHLVLRKEAAPGSVQEEAVTIL